MNTYEESYNSGSDSSDEEDPIDNFFHTNLDAIIDIYDDFRDRFSHNPMFLQKLTSSDLTDLFIDCIFHNKLTYNLTEHETVFYNEYQHEVDISYMLVFPLLYKYKHRLARTTWISFCCSLT
jgi:hypothetical protein